MIQINDKSHCCGCAACVQRCPKHCIVLTEDKEGFLYPKADATRCIECGLCEKVCPVLQQEKPQSPQRCYVAIHPAEEIRKESSSGGVFTAIASVILKEKGVVFGARFDSDWNVVHDYTETQEGLAAFRGSKYLQSHIGNTFQQAEDFLKAGRKVLFTGTPCQIAGLRHFLRKDYPNLLTMDFICHGVPSPLVWQQYLREVRKEHGDIKISQINFRDKTAGWKNFRLRVSQIKDQSESPVISEPFPQNTYMQGFLKNLYLRPSCYSCAAKSSKSGSDLTIGDFWEIHQTLPDWDDDRGTSCVLILTDKGKRYFEQAELKYQEVTYSSISNENPALEHSPVINRKKRALFFKDFQIVPLEQNVSKLIRVNIFTRIIQKLDRGRKQVFKRFFKR